MSLPSFAAFPPSSVRKALGSGEWEEALDLWITIADIWLNAPDSKFHGSERQDGHLSKFLVSFYNELFVSPRRDSTLESPKAQQLRRRTFLLAHRLLSASSRDFTEYLSLNVQFLGSFSFAHLKTQSLAELLQKLWRERKTSILPHLKKTRTNLTNALESGNPNAAEMDLRMLAPLLHSLPQAGAFMTEGSELIDAMFTAYNKGSEGLRTALVPVSYLSLIALTKGETSNRSALLDHLYSLKSQVENNKQSTNLLVDLVTNTPLLVKLQGTPGEKGAERARTLAASLQSLRSSSVARNRPKKQPRLNKGKEIAPTDVTGEQHIHLMSKITQIQDLFPDLGSGFVARLLDSYNEDVELVTSHLLEDSLPPDLASLDRSLQLSPESHAPDPSSQAAIDTLIPSSTPPPVFERRNIYDNDEFDRLEVDSSRFHTGRSNTKHTADDVLADRTKAPQKASILSALAAFDSDDDERDDTYDEADVGGTVDKATPDGEENADVDVGSDVNEEALYRAWRADASIFGRANEIRRSKAREKMKQETAMTDEAIEGWAIMLGRDARKQRRLEGKYAGFDGQQSQIQRTAFRQGPEDEEGGTDSDGPERGGFRGRGRGRGRGGGGRGRGGNVAGAANDAQTQAARQRKEAGKGSRANHNRRDQRAKKMARGGFPG
ncbi:CUE domain-containing protein 2 [Elsinoe australis]|uniref:CUE domain-containing protein 2 n=1 Tax=Elsinoe australis TaxID=40998 RepID=A0A4U7B4L4_9PEZI|nr:CUE domain-containing protein 2 [Elsinoe australis]